MAAAVVISIITESYRVDHVCTVLFFPHWDTETPRPSGPSHVTTNRATMRRRRRMMKVTGSDITAAVPLGVGGA